MRTEEQRRRARENVLLARRYVQENLEVAADMERQGRKAGFVRDRLPVLNELLTLHERDLERIEAVPHGRGAAGLRMKDRRALQ